MTSRHLGRAWDFSKQIDLTQDDDDDIEIVTPKSRPPVSTGEKRRAAQAFLDAQEQARKKTKVEWNVTSSKPQSGPMTLSNKSAPSAHSRTSALTFQPKPSPAPSLMNGGCRTPFMIDDDSDDEAWPPPKPEAQLKSKHAYSAVKPSSVAADAALKDRERQRLESIRMRQEAMERKNRETPSSDGTMTTAPESLVKVESTPRGSGDETNSQRPPENKIVGVEELERLESIRIRQDAVVRENSTIPTRDSIKIPAPKTPIKPPTAPHGGSSEVNVQKALKKQTSEAMNLGPCTVWPPFEKKAEMRDAKPQILESPRVPPYPPQPTSTFATPSVKKAENPDAKPQKTEPVRIQSHPTQRASPKDGTFSSYLDSFDTRVKTSHPAKDTTLPTPSDITGKHVEKLGPPNSAEKPTPNDPEAERQKRIRIENSRRKAEQLQAQIRAAKEAERQAEQDKKDAEDRKTEAAEAQRRQLAAQKEAATQARKGADARSEAEARRWAHEKKVEEERQWAEAKRAQEARRESLKKRQEEARREAGAMSERNGALAKLLQAQRPKDATDHQTPNMAKISATPASPERRSDPLKGFSEALDAANDKIAQQAPKLLTPAKTPAPENQADAARQQRIQAMKERNAKMHQAAVGRDDDQRTSEMAIPAKTLASDVQADAARQQRIEAKKQRNAKMQVAEKEQNDKPEVDAKPVFQPLQRGPVSLNSLAGQERLADLKNGTHVRQNREQPQLNGVNSAPEIEAHCHMSNRVLGEIIPADIRLLKWRNNGMQWPDVRLIYERTLKKRYAVDTLRHRYHLVKKALDTSSVDRALLDRVAAGDMGARRQLNMKVHGTWPMPSPVPLSERPRDAHGHFSRAPKHALEMPSKVEGNELLGSSQGYGFGSRASTTTLGPQDPSPDAERSTTSGKVFNERYMKYHLEALIDSFNEPSDSETLPSREATPMTAEDYCYFLYQIERRQISKSKMDEGESIDDMPWLVCGNPYEHLAEANVEANREVLSVPRGMPIIAENEGNWNLSHESTNDRHEFLTLEGKDTGIVQVRVAQYMRSHDERILPQSKEGWTPRTVFFVKERVTTKSGDEMFERSREKVVEKNVNDTVYTTLDLANTEAVRYFVSRTFRPTSGHLRRREMEIQDVEEELVGELDEDESEMFCQKIEDQHEGMVLEVWVEEGQLAGPRNLD